MGSIKWKMATLYMLLVVAVMLSCGVIILLNLRSSAYRSLFQEFEYTADRIVDVFSIQDLEDKENPQETFGEILTALMIESVNSEEAAAADKSVYLLDENANLLYTRREQLSAADLSSRAILSAMNGEHMEELYIHSGTGGGSRIAEYALRFTLPQNGRSYIIFIRQSTDSVQASLRSTSFIILLITTLGIIVAGVLGYLLAASISRPILRLTSKTKELASGNLSAAEHSALPEEAGRERSGDELGQLEVHFDEMAKELSGMILELQEMEKMQKEFVANVSHELRTPITTVKSYVETLLDSQVEDPELTRQFLGVVDSESDRMAALISDLLELSRMDSNQARVSKKPVDLGEIMRRNLSSLGYEAARKNQTLTWAEDMILETPLVESGEMPRPFSTFMILGDARRLDQVLANLISNALKYSPEGGAVYGGLYHRGKEIHAKIQDNGIGIDEEDQKHIFERFYRVDKTRSRAMGGTGLGLAIAKEMTELQGGRIFVESKLGEGSCFWLIFPAYDEVEEGGEDEAAV